MVVGSLFNKKIISSKYIDWGEMKRKAHDFEFGGKKLSDFGMILCKFGSGGLETVDDIQVEFNTVPTSNGKKHELASVQYENCLESTVQMCKYSCDGGLKEITETEHRELTRWLIRKNFLKLKFLDKEHIDIYYEAAFSSVSRIEFDGKLVGLELNIVTNRPFALKEPRTITVKNLVQDGKHSVNDISHEEGYIYPHTEITIASNGNLNIYNAMEDRNTYIANCVAGEVITMDYPIIKSSLSSHNIQNDFNWNFFRIANSYDNSRNDLTISIPCTIKIEYSPIVKVGL